MKNLFYVASALLITTLANCQKATDSTFLTFVGEKISVREVLDTNDQPAFDRKFIATYKVIQTVYGKYGNDTITFEAYIHLGDSPAFSRFNNALLYLSRYNNKWYHEKYQFDAVYLAANGRWAGVGESDDYSHSYNTNIKFKPEKIPFDTNLSFETAELSPKQRDLFYPPLYYLYKGTKAYPIFGNYVEELFYLKKNGILKARGLF